MAFVWLPVALCVCFLLRSWKTQRCFWGPGADFPAPRNSSGSVYPEDLKVSGSEMELGLLCGCLGGTSGRYSSLGAGFPGSCVCSPWAKFKIPHYRAQEELEILRAGQFERVSWPCPWIIPLTNALCAQRPVRRRYFVPRSIGAGINRILLFPRTDDSLTA